MFYGVGLWVVPPNKIHGSHWNTVWIPIDRMDLCQTHCKQVPDFFQFLPSGQYGLCFGYCFSGRLPLRSPFNSPPFGVCFRELHAEIDQIHLSIEAQCVTVCLPIGDCHNGISHQAIESTYNNCLKMINNFEIL